MPSPEDTQWFVIDDYTPGIRHIVSPGQPVGSATQNLTWGCHSNESKGLTPAPAPVRTWTFDPSTQLPGLSTPSSLVSESFRIGGLFCNDPVFTPNDTETGQDQNNSEIYVGFEWWTSGMYHRSIQRLLRHRLNPTWENVYDTHISQTYEPLSRPKRCYFATGRSNDADPEQVGPIVIGWVYGGMARYFPDDTDTDSGSTVAFPGESVALVSPDTLVTHQGRAVIFPLSLSFMGDPTIISVTNENFYWTDVNNWRDLEPNLAGKYFNVIAGYENPTGYGVVASNDASELLLIKARGGAILIRGDLDNFSAQTLPNVRGTGQALDLGCHTPIGYMYPVDASQMWLWAGGDTTINVAPFLKPDFYRAPGEDLDGNLTGWGYHFTQMSSWGNYVMAPNNYFCDTDTLSPEGVPSWWLLDDQLTYRYCKYTTDWKGRHMYAAQMGFRSADDPILVEYDARVRRPGYSWQSQPLPITIDPADHIEITAVALVAVGEGTVDVTVSTEQNPEGQTRTFTYESDDENILARRYATRQVRAFSVVGSHPQIRYRARSIDPNQPAPQICPPTAIAYHPHNQIPTNG